MPYTSMKPWTPYPEATGFLMIEVTVFLHGHKVAHVSHERGSTWTGGNLNAIHVHEAMDADRESTG